MKKLKKQQLSNLRASYIMQLCHTLMYKLTGVLNQRRIITLNAWYLYQRVKKSQKRHFSQHQT